MDKLSELIIGSTENLRKKNVIWNIIGSTAYAMTSVVLLMIVTQGLGAEQGGIFAIAFTTSQIMLTISYYEMRPYQVTDVLHKYTFKEYFTVRLITTCAMIIISIIYIIISSYTLEKSMVIMLLCIYKAMDGIADVFEGQFQLNNQLHLAGKAITFEIIVSSIAFILSILISKNLLTACFILTITFLFSVLIFNFIFINKYFEIGISKNRKAIINLLKACLPLFLGAFMSIYISNSAKYAIDKLMTEMDQVIYNIIFMPAFTINLFSGFIFKPLLTSLASYWSNREYDEFKKLVLRLSGYVAVLTLSIILLGHFLGIPFLSRLYGVDVSLYHLPFIIILIGGGFNAINTILYYALTVMRSQTKIFLGYLIVFIMAWLFPMILVKKCGITGAAISYSLLLMLLTTILATFLIYFCCNTVNKQKRINDTIDGKSL